MGIAVSRGYVVFSLLAGIAGVIAGLAAGIPADNGIVALLGLALVIGTATAWRYDSFKRILGPIVTVAAVMAAYTVFAITTAELTFGVQLSSGYGIGLMLLGYPAIVLAYFLMLFVPSFAFFLIIRKIFRFVKRKNKHD